MDMFKLYWVVFLCIQADTSWSGVAADDEECHRPADVMFVLDESGSIWGEHFKDQLSFVNDVISSFDEKAHFGVMTFADDAIVHVGMNEISDQAQLQAAVTNIAQRRGNTRTDLALERMRTSGFSSARLGIPLIGIVITDGGSDYPDKTSQEADETHAAGMIMFAVGVGINVIQEELEKIASADEYVFRVESYDVLDKLKELLASEACRASTPRPTPPPTPPPTTPPTTPPQHGPGNECRPSDVIFALPDEADVHNTNLTLTFLQDVVRDLDISPTEVRVGITPRLCNVQQPPIALSQHHSSAAYRADLQQRYLASSLISDQMEQLIAGHDDVEYYDPDRGDVGLPAYGRGVDKIAILFVDNIPADPNYAAQLTEAAGVESISMVVVGIGGYVDSQQVAALAAGPGNSWFHVDSYEALWTIREEMFDLVCSYSRRHRY